MVYLCTVHYKSWHRWSQNREFLPWQDWTYLAWSLDWSLGERYSDQATMGSISISWAYFPWIYSSIDLDSRHVLFLAEYMLPAAWLGLSQKQNHLTTFDTGCSQSVKTCALPCFLCHVLSRRKDEERGARNCHAMKRQELGRPSQGVVAVWGCSGSLREAEQRACNPPSGS